MDQEEVFEVDYEYYESEDEATILPTAESEPLTSVEHQTSRTSNRSVTAKLTVFDSSKNVRFGSAKGTLDSLRSVTNAETIDGEDYDFGESNEDDTVAQFETSMRMSFFDKIANLPTIEEISSASEETIIETAQEEKTVDMSLTGKFVDPLTGLDIVESEHSEIIDYECDFEEMDEICEEEADVDELQITEDSELLELQVLEAMEEVEEVKPRQHEDEFFDSEHVQKIMLELDLQDFKQALAEDTQRQNVAVVVGFIDDLLQLVSDAAQYKDPNEILRKTIDKRKLMDEISVKIRALEVEQSVRHYLNRKVVDHHKRKQMYRAIIDDSAEDLEFLMAKYQDQLQSYNYILGKQDEVDTVTKLKIDTLTARRGENERLAHKMVRQFEEMVKHALIPKIDKLEEGENASKRPEKGRYDERLRIITIYLKKMANVRKELSEARLEFIKKQHAYADLKERLNKIQDIGNGLKLYQYENLQNEVMQLGKKVDERDTELAKARNIQQLDTHINTHLRERTLMLRNQLAVQKMTYKTLLKESQDTRRHLYKQKQVRSHIRKEMREHAFQGGILSKPTLMLDYDQTEDQILQKREIVEGLRSQYSKLVEKIAYYEEMLNSRSIESQNKKLKVKK
ncbi:kinesin-like protein KIF20B [Ceratitis capitata]|uniref:kinesin-like protein KIF20B n=1 Tax=Ceratitis capitata TaxID=7213 RepID=UPI000329C6CC|nr:kinesin-like protein KIF20B [Ceratitis capitata]